MRTVFTSVFTLLIISNSIELSSQTDGNLSSQRRSASSPGKQHFPDRTFPRPRSRSPSGDLPSARLLGYDSRELGYVRLIPRTNQNQRFEFRRYVFLVAELLQLRIRHNSYMPVPTREQIVLSTFDGDVFAILDNSGILQGIYKRNGARTRVKIDIPSGAVDDMTKEEAKDCPVGKYYPIFQTYNIVVSNYDSLQSDGIPNRERYIGSSTGRKHSPQQSSTTEVRSLLVRSSSPPGRPSTINVLGHAFERLGYVRLSPRTNQTLQFEFRRYFFPANASIILREERQSYGRVPAQEHIVLSASNGDVFAILQNIGTLRGIYRTDRNHSRVKINMLSVAVINMTPVEIRDCPIGKRRPIFPNSFIEHIAEFDSLQELYN